MKINGSHKITEIEVSNAHPDCCIHTHCANQYGSCSIYKIKLRPQNAPGYERCSQCLEDFPAEVKDA